MPAKVRKNKAAFVFEFRNNTAPEFTVQAHRMHQENGLPDATRSILNGQTVL
jgi:hypothetical protein